MTYKNTRGAINQYTKVKTSAAIEDASPHKLIQMLMEGALEKIAMAKNFIDRGDIPNKGSHISWAISIIDGLKVSLNKDAGGDIAENLDMLYDYMQRRLVEANLHSDKSILDEVAGLLNEIKGAWDAIPVEYQEMRPNAPVEPDAEDRVSVIS
ncbi:Flagellar biosynthesis protein FliS [hydrothermal vent metagenome]|uniref:Flagellar biosynthesis protein FliS n=1 Tax=hydrothermal vent metagenome TaxID=652676 RepID=A0A3B0Z854_9ZZZZ